MDTDEPAVGSAASASSQPGLQQGDTKVHHATTWMRFLLVMNSILIPAVSAITICSIVFFWTGGDRVWAISCIVFSVISFLFNLAVSWNEEESTKKVCLSIASLLQIKTIADAIFILRSDSLRYFSSDHENLLKEMRALKYFSIAIHTLFISVLLSYVLMLVNVRIPTQFAAAAVVVFDLTFAIGTAEFAAENEHFLTKLLVFTHTIAQFSQRVLALCGLWVRFMHFGLIASAVSWLIVYIFGPQGILEFLPEIFSRRKSHFTESASALALGRVFITPLSFFLVINAQYEGAGGDSVMSYDCIASPKFLMWRLFENGLMIFSFVFIPVQVRDAKHYHAWLCHPEYVLVFFFVTLMVVCLTWLMIQVKRPRTSRTPATPVPATPRTPRTPMPALALPGRSVVVPYQSLSP